MSLSSTDPARERFAILMLLICCAFWGMSFNWNKQAQEALAILKFAPQGASEPVYKLVASAIANARVKADASNTYLDEQDLYVKTAFVDEGTTLKRFQPRAQGRAFRINKRTSHITIVLGTPEEGTK